jgi:hypothetical protein
VKVIDREEFEQLLTHSEDTWLDWKRDFPKGLILGPRGSEWEKGKGELLKDLVSIANSDDNRTGFLVYGVKDHGTRREVTGIGKSWDDADFQGWVENVFSPLPKFSYSEIAWSGENNVGLFRIEKSSEYPHVVIRSVDNVIFQGQVWFRRGSKNTVAHYDELKRMFVGEEPFKISNTNDPIFKIIEKYYEEKGRKIFLPGFGQKDSYLARGHELAVYPPGSRREVWVGEVRGRYEHILMVRPQKK